MALSIYQASVPVFVRSLNSLKNILAKGATHAQAKKIDEEAFMQARLAPDMFPLTTQVHIATDMARGGAARLTGSEPPKYEDTEKTFAELIARVEKTIAYVQSLPEASFDGGDTRTITRPVRGQPKTFTGVNYLQQFIVPNLYFHTTTVYDLLRHNGVELGKPDFIGSLD
ncbi:MAG: DUF1993 domain-containing protein [Betaproteobacteria bacterium]